MKRIIAFITTVTILASLLCGAMPVQADSNSKAFADKVSLLSMLEIISKVGEDEAKTTIVTRAEFAQYVAGIMGLGNFDFEGMNYFNDVPDDHWAVGSINALAQRGVISVAADKKFNPNAKITTHEALKMVLCAAGYGEYASIKGGYPTGYIFIARKLGINMGAEGELTLYNAIQLLYSAILAPLYEQVVFTTDGMVTYKESAETLLSVNYHMYSMEGLVTYAEGLAIDDKGEDEDGFVRVKKQTYKTDLALLDSVGRYCRFIVKDNKDAIDEIVILNTEEIKDRQLEIDIEDFLGYNAGRVSYYDSKGNSRDVKLAANATIVKNGEIKDTNISGAFKNDGTPGSLKKGTIRLIDENSDNSYDYALIFDYRNIVVDSVNPETGDVYDIINPGNSVKLNPERTDKKIVIRNVAGSRMKYSDITSGTILSVYESTKFVMAVASVSEVTGKIFKIGSVKNGMPEVSIGKVESDVTSYRFDKDYFDKKIVSSANIVVGTSGTFYTDFSGKIAYIKFEKATDWDWCYLIDCDVEDGPFEDTLKLKVCTESGAVKVYDTIKKVKVDENSKEGHAAICAALSKTAYGKTLAGDKGEDDINGQVIRIKLNKDEKVIAIDTENTSPQEASGQTMKRTVDRASKTNNWYSSSFYDPAGSNGAIMRGSNTVIFAVPEYDDQLAADDDYFMKLAVNYFKDGSFVLEAFKTDQSASFEDVIVVYGNPDAYGNVGVDSPERVSYIVENIGRTLNAEGENVGMISVVSLGGLRYDFETTPEYDFKAGYLSDAVTIESGGETEAVLAEGDLVRFIKDVKGNIKGAKIIFDESRKDDPTFKLKMGPIDNIYSTDITGFYHAYVKSYSDGVIRLRKENPNDNVEFGTNEYTSNPHRNDFMSTKLLGGILIFDSQASGEKIYVGTEADIITADKLGSDAKPIIFTTGGGGLLTGAIIYR